MTQIISATGSEPRTLDILAAGDIDMATAPALAADVAAALAAGATELRLDLGDVTFVDSSGINAIAPAIGRVQVVLVDPTEPVLMVFEVAGLLPLVLVERSPRRLRSV